VGFGELSLVQLVCTLFANGCAESIGLGIKWKECSYPLAGSTAADVIRRWALRANNLLCVSAHAALHSHYYDGA
jgi:hypothetical protein